MPMAPNPQYGDPIRVYVNGKFRWWSEMSDTEKGAWRRAHPERYEGAGADTEGGKVVSHIEDVEKKFDLPAYSEKTSLLKAIEQNGGDTDDAEVQLFVSQMQSEIDSGGISPEQIQFYALAMAQSHPSAITTQYSQAFEASGFSGAYDPRPTAGQAQLGRLEGMEPEKIFGQPDPFRISAETDFTQFRNGVLVTPDGQVLYEPGSNAPGSTAWRAKIGEWAPEKVKEWRNTLFKMGYLTKEDTKVKGVDTVFKDALQKYHDARYQNGGKPIAGDLTAANAEARANRPKPINLEDFSSQIRNDVREQYERIYGVRPTDGETELWSSYIIKQGMSMQRRNIGKYDSPMTESAATEAEEKFIEKLEKTPGARFLRESEEENTELRDTFERMAQVTSSLAG